MSCIGVISGSWGWRVFQLVVALAHLLLFSGLTSAVQTSTELVAIVTDAEGKISWKAPSGMSPISILSRVPEQALIELGAAARLVVVYFSGGDEFQLLGPAVVRFGPTGPGVLKGAPLHQRKSVMPTFRVSRDSVAQSAVLMRSLRDQGPVVLREPLGRIVSRQPRLRWNPVAGAVHYALSITDAAAKEVYLEETSDTSRQLPEELDDSAGKIFTWKVQAHLQNGEIHTNWALFEIPSQADYQRILQSLPRQSATVSERVAFALWLEQEGFFSDARRYWDDLAKVRTDAPALIERARFVRPAR